MYKTMMRFLVWASCWFVLSAQVMATTVVRVSQAELDQMLAPVALYPDALLSQILMASTYPDQVQEAARWSAAHPDERGDDAVNAVAYRDWDPSVSSLVAFPQVLSMCADKPDWVRQLGDAFLLDPDMVMDTVQSLRRKAQEAGNLRTSEQQRIVVDNSDDTTIIIIEPADPKIVYVPTYNPVVVYGSWWWPDYRPFYYTYPVRYYPVGYTFGDALFAGIGFGLGVAITHSLWSDCDWHRRDINVNVYNYNNIYVDRRIIVDNDDHASWRHYNHERRDVYVENRDRLRKSDTPNFGLPPALPKTNRELAKAGYVPPAREDRRSKVNDTLKNSLGVDEALPVPKPGPSREPGQAREDGRPGHAPTPRDDQRNKARDSVNSSLGLEPPAPGDRQKQPGAEGGEGRGSGKPGYVGTPRDEQRNKARDSMNGNLGSEMPAPGGRQKEPVTQDNGNRGQAKPGYSTNPRDDQRQKAMDSMNKNLGLENGAKEPRRPAPDQGGRNREAQNPGYSKVPETEQRYKTREADTPRPQPKAREVEQPQSRVQPAPERRAEPAPTGNERRYEARPEPRQAQPQPQPQPQVQQPQQQQPQPQPKPAKNQQEAKPGKADLNSYGLQRD